MKTTSEIFDTNNNLLRVTLEGEFSLHEAETQFIDTLDGVAKYQATKVLIDGRAITGEIDAVQRYLYGSFVAEAVGTIKQRGLAQAPQFAYVLLQPILDLARLGQIVALNRGMNVRAFDNMSAAERWLNLTDPASKTPMQAKQS
jgi:hypothetical protein